MTASTLVIILLFSLVISIQGTLSQSTLPGVASGDHFYYEMYSAYTSNQPNSTLVIPQFERNNTDWTRINITTVEGTVVHQVYTLHLKNGSETGFVFQCDVAPESSRNLMFNEKGVPLCGANLNVGDIVPTANLVITETVSRAYGSGVRESNHICWNTSDDWGNLYFDRETGVLVELSRTHRFCGNGSGEIVDKTDVIELTGTNRWQVNVPLQQQPPKTALSVVLAAAILIAISNLVIILRLATKVQNGYFVRVAANYK